MIAVGERINGMFTDVKRAIQEQDKSVIQDLARGQTEAGASYLDVNVGTAAADKAATMRWLVETVQEAVDTPIAVDSQNIEVTRAGLQVCKNKSMINSTQADPEKLEAYIALALEHDADLVGLTMDARGVPQDVNTRLEIAATLITAAMEKGLEFQRLFIDPIVIPVNVAQDQPGKILEVIQQIRMLSDPPPHIIVGLSNLSQSTQERPLINRTFLVMAVAAGLDAAIVDVFDKELMDAWITAEMTLNKHIYSDSFLAAAKRR